MEAIKYFCKALGTFVVWGTIAYLFPMVLAAADKKNDTQVGMLVAAVAATLIIWVGDKFFES